MKTIINYSVVFLLATALVQCAPKNEPEEEHGHEEHAETQEEAVVVLSRVQVASAGIKTGTFDTMSVSGYVNANGIFDLPPENIAAINAPMAGIVKRANYLEGSYVNKGAVMLVLQHPDYIKLQEEYAGVLASLGYLEAEYKRQRTLDSANVAARKRLQQAEAEYRTAATRKLSLEKQLAYIGMDPGQVAAGQIKTDISVRAPFSGYITRLNVHKGEYVQPEQELYELINTDHMHLELNVFEKDIASVRKGQPIRFTVPSLGTESYQGDVFLVGKSFDPESKTVKVHGHFHRMKPEFIRGLYLEATIVTGQEQVRALPEEAVIRDQGKTYIFIRDEEEQHQDGEHHHEEENADQSEEHQHQDNGTPFRRLEVVTGISRGGMIEIREVEDFPADAGIVTRGAYDIFAEMKKGEGGHRHAH